MSGLWKCAVVALMLAAVPLMAAKYNQVVEIGAPMPEFSNLPAADGSSLSSKDIGEDVVVLVFLANHCPWVQGMDADLVKTVASFQSRSVRFVGISLNKMDEDRLPAMKQHAEKAGYNFTYLYDESQDLGRKLGATRTPEYFVFDKGRKLVYTGLLHNSPAQMRSDGTVNYTKGAPMEFYVQEAVESALTAKAVETTETRASGCTLQYESVK
jgi:peroxiredoxin